MKLHELNENQTVVLAGVRFVVDCVFAPSEAVIDGLLLALGQLPDQPTNLPHTLFGTETGMLVSLARGGKRVPTGYTVDALTLAD